MGTVMITGCSSGFGRDSAVDLARAGERVFATMPSPERGRELLERATAEQLHLTVHQLDVNDPGRSILLSLVSGFRLRSLANRRPLSPQSAADVDRREDRERADVDLEANHSLNDPR